MPITPLHYGTLAPVNHWFPGKVSVVSFTLVNLWMDGNAILYFAFGLDRPELHSPFTHSLLAGIVLASIIALCRFKSRKWVLGAYYGGITQVALDALVHPEMEPMYPIHWNPLYTGQMEMVSLILLPFTLWFIVQCVSYTRDWVHKRLEAAHSEKS